MDKNLDKYILMLEFDKIRSLLKEQAICNDTKRLINDLRPNNNYQEVLAEIVKTDDACKLINRFNIPNISFVLDIKKIVDKTKILAQLTSRELLFVSDFLGNIHRISKWKRQSQDKKTSLDYLFNNIILIRDLKTKIDNIVISEDKIADNASENLAIIRSRLNRNLIKIKDTLDGLIKSEVHKKCFQEQIVTIRDGRFVVPVKSEYRSEIKGFVHGVSYSGATLFIEPISVVEINNEIKILENQEKEEISKILDMLSEQVRLNADKIIQNYDILIKIDFYFAKAKLGINMNAIMPQINNTQKINLIKARHPLIDKNDVVPININLGHDFNSLIITGPNTGGKTVVLKTVGLFTVMIMSGLLIPVSEGSEISVFDNILVDIGDEQSIEQSLSTFSSHMTNIIYILKKATSRSLVLIDELGAGTDPVEGASLAIAILDEFRLQNTKVVATTHYSEIKLYALNTPGVENASCEFDIESLRPTYKLAIGVPGKSNAFLISKKLGLKDNILDRAKLLIGDDKNKFENVILKLESSRAKLEKQNQEVETLKQQIQQDKNNIEQIKAKLDKDKEQELKKLKSQTEKILLKVEAKSQEIFQELEDILKQKNNANFEKMVADLKFDIRSKLKKTRALSEVISYNLKHSVDVKQDRIDNKIQLGDTVKILDINQQGVVVRDKDKDGFYLIQMGNIKNKVNGSNLVIVNTQARNKNSVKSVVNKSYREPGFGEYSSKKFGSKIKSELNLRGKTVEEALIDLDKFIDDAVVLGLLTVRVVHGKGTGVLRTAVSEFLKTDKRVKNFRLGVYGEGEDGVTIASLK